MKRYLIGAAVLGLGAMCVAFGGRAASAGSMEVEKRLADPRNAQYTVGDKKSGYAYATKSTRNVQDDDFANPGFVWVDIGKENWSKKDGTKGKACASCHGAAETTMKGVSNRLPKYSTETKKMTALQHQVNSCRETRMGAKPWKWESDEMLGMAAYIRSQSRGMPIDIEFGGPATPFYLKGKAFFEQRRGLLDMACKHCHADYAGTMIRSNVLSQAMPTGFPVYRLKWQKVGSLHRRFRGCNKQVRSKPYKQGAEEYTNLELYLMVRASGLPGESPAVRN